MEPRIERRGGFGVAVKASAVEMGGGKPNPIPSLWDEYFAAGLHEKVAPALGVCGPMRDGKGFDYGIGDFLPAGRKAPDGFATWAAPESEWAVFPCTGPMPGAIQDGWERAWKWLPESGYRHREGIVDLEVYADGDARAEGYKSEIWLPVEAAR